MENTPGWQRDNEGPRGALRLRIPSALVGMSFDKRKREEYEEREMVHQSKHKKT